jgi:hypothetical protein
MQWCSMHHGGVVAPSLDMVTRLRSLVSQPPLAFPRSVDKPKCLVGVLGSLVNFWLDVGMSGCLAWDRISVLEPSPHPYGCCQRLM